MNKWLDKHNNNRFNFVRVEEEKHLRNYPEKWFLHVVHIYVNETLEEDVRACIFTAADVRNGLLKLLNGFALKCHRYNLVADNYWDFTIKDNKVNICRAGETNPVAFITVNSNVKNDLTTAEILQ